MKESGKSSRESTVIDSPPVTLRFAAAKAAPRTVERDEAFESEARAFKRTPVNLGGIYRMLVI